MSTGKVWSGDRLGMGEGLAENNTIQAPESEKRTAFLLKLLEPEH